MIGPGNDDATEQHFTGKERDAETGFTNGNDYFGARYYASEFGRFISPDWSAQVGPVPYAVMDDPQSLNLYSYVQNGPLIRMDIDGHFGGISYDLSNLFNDYETEVQQQQQAQQQQQQAQEAQQTQQQQAQQQSNRQSDGSYETAQDMLALGNIFKWGGRGKTIVVAADDFSDLAYASRRYNASVVGYNRDIGLGQDADAQMRLGLDNAVMDFSYDQLFVAYLKTGTNFIDDWLGDPAVAGAEKVVDADMERVRDESAQYHQYLIQKYGVAQ